MKNIISNADYERAIEVGKRAMQEPFATAARFNARTHTLALIYSNGMTLAIDIRQSPILSAYQNVDLSSPYVTPGGDGLLFDKAGLSFGIPSLVASFLPESLARQKIASILGKVKSSAKAASSKENGAKGGRPRKNHEHVMA
jgi:hypothetical protein